MEAIQGTPYDIVMRNPTEVSWEIKLRQEIAWSPNPSRAIYSMDINEVVRELFLVSDPTCKASNVHLSP